MVKRKQTMHTSRPLEIKDMELRLAKNFERVLKLKRRACKVTLEEYDKMQPCKMNSVPHCHYTVHIEYDETNKLKERKKKGIDKQ